MASEDQRRFRAGSLAPALAALLVLVVFLGPGILFGEGLSPVGLVIAAVGVLAAGMLMRKAGGTWRSTGRILVYAGLFAVAIAGGLLVLLLAGWGRGY
jgi:hypothetical protein